MTVFLARASIPALLVGLTALAIASSPVEAHESAEHNCATIGQWIDPASGELRAHDTLIEAASKRSVVMLGETHPNIDHHRWQLSTIGALYGRRPEMVLGFEAFPRAVQPVLDRWVAGDLSEDAFLEDSAWTKNWGFDPELYLPMFHFARLHRVPMIALNVERDFVSRIGEESLDNIPEDERRGLTEPATPDDAYLDELALVFSQHLDVRSQAPVDAEHGSEAEETDADAAESHAADDTDEPVDVRDDPRFQRFTRVQTTWDRAMAQALAKASARPEAPLVVGILGSGHLEKGFGVPFQLRDLGLIDTAVFLPIPPTDDCAAYKEEVADALFVLPALAEVAGDPSGPRLGVMIETADDRVRVLQVLADSVAAAADIRDGDAILKAAGVALKDTSELIGIVQQQAPGTWLPLAIERDGETLEIVAKFPASSPNGHAKP
ncbi:MAG: ChaN family lipoprotein [Geminicoccaceae bacterium]